MAHDPAGATAAVPGHDVGDFDERLGAPQHGDEHQRAPDVALRPDLRPARRVRREFFLDLLGRGVVDRVAVGHTLSDQAETVLFRFLRGSGVAGLAGIRPVTREGFVRPLIEVRREEVLQFLNCIGSTKHSDSCHW